MSYLVSTNRKGDNITTSLIIAETFGKNPSDVLRDIRNLHCSEDFRERNFALMVDMKPLPQGGAYKTDMYEITKDGFSFLVMGYTGEKAAEFKETFITEFNKRDAMLKSDDYILQRSQEILTNRMKALEMVLEQKDRRIELQAHELKMSAPKVEYFENVLQSETSITTNVIAKELGMSAILLNRKLRVAGVIYNQSGTWVLYAKYQSLGYTKTKTFHYTDNHGNPQTAIQTVWTEKGREYIHKLLTSQKITA